MVEADKARFATVMYWLAEKYPLIKGKGALREEVPRELSKKDLGDWFRVLQDLHIERIEWGADWYYGHKKFFPHPADLREAAEQAPTPKALQLAAPVLKPDTTPPEVRKKQVAELLNGFEGKIGKSERKTAHG